MIVIDEYQSRWPEEFARIREQLLDALGPLAQRIDHIGSTSVPGLGAKDIIDVQVTVRALTEVVHRKLVDSGYVHLPHITADHIPAGDDPDPALWKKLIFRERPGERRANIHVRVDGQSNQRYALLFRDYLRAHPQSARSIEIVKRELARRHADDADAYYDIKDPVYDLIWDAARAWARSTGWKPA